MRQAFVSGRIVQEGSLWHATVNLRGQVIHNVWVRTQELAMEEMRWAIARHATRLS